MATAFSNKLAAQPLILSKLDAGIRFHQLDTQRALSNPSVFDSVQDKFGFIWVATADGLNRVDAQDTRVFRSSKKPYALAHSHVSDLLIDSSDRLWVGTKSGPQQYNFRQNNFQPVYITEGKSRKRLTLNTEKLFVDSKDNLWISSENGAIFRGQAKALTVSEVSIKHPSIGKIYLRDFIESSQGYIYALSNKGLLKFVNNQFETIHFAQHKLPLWNALSTTKFQEKYFIGTTTGLFVVSLATGKYQPVKQEALARVSITALKLSHNGNLIIGTRQSGVYILDIESNQLARYTNQSGPFGLLDNQITSVSQSDEGLIWIGTNLGINTLNLSPQLFKHFKVNKNDLNCLSGNTVHSIFQDSKNNLWVASFGSGLHKIDLTNNQCTWFKDLEKEKSDGYLLNVTTMHEDQQGKMWFGTYSNGVYKYDDRTHRFSSLTNILATTQKTPRYVTDIINDKQNNLWIATQSQGLFSYNAITNTLENPNIYRTNEEKVDAINSIAFDQKNNIWLATRADGLWKQNPKSKRFEKINLQYQEEKIPEFLYSVTNDKQGKLWIGSQNDGLFILSPSNLKTTRLHTGNGLSSNIVMNVVIDNNNNGWLMTENGISRVNHDQKEIKTFYLKDGLQANAFTAAAHFSSKPDIIWTGGINGFNYFSTNNLDTPMNNRKVGITDFELFYSPVEISEDSPLPQNTVLLEELYLKYYQNVFSFKFSSFNYLNSNNEQFQFMLEGYDSTWNSVPSERRYASYTNIEPGHYTFKVKLANSGDSLDSIVKKIKVIVSPPWWETKTAYATYIFGSLLVLFIIIQLRTSTLRRRTSLLENMVTLRTAELNKEKEKIEALLSIKNDEIANVSHEFRTPITLILGPIKKLLDMESNEGNLRQLNVIQRNAFRLLRMVEQLLSLESFRVQAITQKTTLSVGPILRRLFESFSDLCGKKSISFSIRQIDDIDLTFTPDAIERIVLNLLSNAYKYTQQGGSINAEAVLKKGCYIITIADSGIGIPKDQHQQVFKRYYRHLNQQSDNASGVGIGLSLVKELVEQHKGRVTLQSEEGIGTTIEISLPVNIRLNKTTPSGSISNEMIEQEVYSLSHVNDLKHPGDRDESSFTDIDTSNIGSPKVLLVEDNTDMQNYIKGCISDNYHVVVANNGEEGLTIAEQEIPDIIITDIMMPIMDGFELSYRLRKMSITSHIPIIILSARSDRESRLKGWEHQADEYLVKPFSETELLLRLDNILEIRKILRVRYSASVIDQGSVTHPKSESPIDNKQSEWLIKLNKEVEDNYQNPKLKVNDLAQILFVSERQLSRKLKAITGLSPTEYINQFRLEEGKKLLLAGNSVTFVALEVGFSSQSYFSKCFKAKFGVTPNQL